MKICIRKTMAAIAVACCPVAASQAAMIVNDSFDTYATQAAFEAVWAPIGSGTPSSAELSTAQASSSPNSVRVPGSAAATGRNRQSFAETGAASPTNRIVFSYDFYDATPTGNPQRNYVNLQDTTAPGSTNQLIALGFNNNQISTDSGGNFYMARILGFNPPTVDPDGGPNETGTLAAGAFFKLNDFGVVRSAGWRNLKVVIGTDDGLSTDFSFYVDNVLAERVSNFGTAAQIRSYDNIALGSGLSNGNTQAFFDNVRLETVPEPATALLTATLVGLIGLVRRRRHG